MTTSARPCTGRRTWDECPVSEAVILERVNRAESPKDAIPRGPRHPALESLAASCKSTLDRETRLLEFALSGLDSDGKEESVTNALVTVKHCTKAINAVEGYGMPPLHCQSEQAVFLNGVLTTMHGEVGLPFPCPAVSCTSSNHYFTHPATNTVHVPLSEASFLLHMPDFYHELGHLLLEHSDYAEKSQIVLSCMASAVEAIDAWYPQLTDNAGRKSAHAPAQDDVAWMRNRWKDNWVQEAFCDLFALFAAGPAYAYSNLYLVSKTDASPYRLNLLAGQDHPSGEARMRLLDAGMRLLGHGREAAHIREVWDSLAQLYGDPPEGYWNAFPTSLLRDIASAIIPALGRAGLRGYSGEGGAAGEGAGGATVAALLNDAWMGFWRNDGRGFRDLERALISRLASMSRGGGGGAAH